MNTETGKVYRTPEDINAAIARGERVEPVSDRVADLMAEARHIRLENLRRERAARREGVLLRRSRARRARNRTRDRIAKTSRKANRRR
jgi:hypothetical protein